MRKTTGRRQRTTTRPDRSRTAVKEADAGTALGISIYAVFYSAGGADKGEAFLANLVRGERKG